jgi:hypothetical protein
MRKAFVSGLVLSALAAVAPASAEKLYVPVHGAIGSTGRALPTEISVSNFDAVERPFSTNFLQAGGAGLARSAAEDRTAVPADRAVRLDRLAPRGQAGLLEIDAAPELLVDAVVRNGHTFTAVPVISPNNRLAAGDSARLLGLDRKHGYDGFEIAVANLGDRTAACDAELFGADGGSLGRTSVQVEALSLGKTEDAASLLGGSIATSAQVTCDQPFFAYAAIVSRGNLSLIAPSAPEVQIAASKIKDDPFPIGTVFFRQEGTFHVATSDHAKGILRIPLAKTMELDKMVIDWDVTPGPWNPKNPSGNHALIWLHRGKFRSNTVANVNAFGPHKDFVKMIQNLDMAAHTNTNVSTKLALERGTTYHLHYVYDAANRDVMVQVMQGSEVLRTAHMKGSAQNKEILVQATGFVAEFGHYKTQKPPEVASIGWAYSNLVVAMIPKK